MHIKPGATERTSKYLTAQWLQFNEVFFKIFLCQCSEKEHNKLFLGFWLANSICTHLFSGYSPLTRKDYIAMLQFMQVEILFLAIINSIHYDMEMGNNSLSISICLTSWEWTVQSKRKYLFLHCIYFKRKNHWMIWLFEIPIKNPH